MKKEVRSIDELDEREAENDKGEQKQGERQKFVSKKKKSGTIRWLLIVTAATIIVALVLSGISALLTFRGSIKRQAQTYSSALVSEVAQQFSDELQEARTQAENYIFTLSRDNVTDASEFRAALEAFTKENGKIARIRYMKNGELYDQVGVRVNSDINESIVELAKSNDYGVTGVVNDPELSQDVIIIGFPVIRYSMMDYCLLMYPMTLFYEQLDGYYKNETEVGQYAYFTGLLSGKYMYGMRGSDQSSSELEDYLEELTGDTTDYMHLLYMARSGGGAYDLDAHMGDMVVAMDTTAFLGTELNIIGFFEVNTICSDANLFLSGMLVIILILGILLMTLATHSVYSIAHRNKFEDLVVTVDPVIGCATYDYYAYETTELVGNDPYSNYSIVFLKYYYYEINKDQFGEKFQQDMLRFTAKSIDQLVTSRETYGYYPEGMFVLTMRYNKTEDLINRLKVLYAVLYNYPEMRAKGMHLNPQFGIYNLTKMSITDIGTMVERAATAVRAKNNGPDMIYKFYTDEASEAVQREKEIERKMENALRVGDFKVFYQPIYSVENKTLDSAEALVRWYDSETGRYYMPVEFIQLFEVNQFVVKMDKFVINEVFRFQKENQERGQKLTPISVNISRVTAIQEDFADYCMEMRQRYGLPNDSVIFEFPESFALYSFDVMKKLLADLTKKGFRCAIDNFGRSPMQILKEIDFYQVKLDRYFLRRGKSHETDKLLIESNIRIAKQMGLRVVQEGVETRDDFEELTKMGCDAIQGYFYSKPLSMADYLDFVNQATPFGI
ncbi:MAG: EAL domain-containing protein [Clostridia bacterium]|nr:EAL domain-containing protein [Clostridia bacterium]